MRIAARLRFIRSSRRDSWLGDPAPYELFSHLPMPSLIKTPPQSKPLGVLSDVHGNLAALRAVLDALHERGVHDIVVAGDLLWGGAEPLEVWKLLHDVRARCVRGMSDNALVRLQPSALAPRDDRERQMAERFVQTRRQIGELVVAHLAKLPETLRIPLIDGRELVVVHGSPSDPTQEMSQDMDDEELMALLADDPADVVVCGATHVPFQRQMGDVWVVNAGSVGAAPEGAIAHYTILRPRMEGMEVEQLYVPYSDGLASSLPPPGSQSSSQSGAAPA
jgi:putative phosphoesterase